MRQFVPIEDEIPTEALQEGERLVPYQPGLVCEHRLAPARREGGVAEPRMPLGVVRRDASGPHGAATPHAPWPAGGGTRT